MNKFEQIGGRKVIFAGVCLAIVSIGFFIKMISPDLLVDFMKFILLTYLGANVTEKVAAQIAAARAGGQNVQ